MSDTRQSELIVTRHDEDTWSVEDPDGGTWWANQDGNALINTSEDPPATARALAEETHTNQWGRWHC